MSDIKVIDIHAHIVPPNVFTGGLLAGLGGMTGDQERVLRRARRAGIDRSMILSIDDRPVDDPDVSKLLADPHFFVFCDYNPIDEKQMAAAERQLAHPKVIGIKCHPPRRGFDFLEHADAIFGFARKHKVPILVHSQPHTWMCDPFDCVEAANAHPDVNLVLAHLGISSAHLTSDDHIDAILRSKHNNVFVDTSYINSIYPGLVEKAVQALGSERIVFGTDNPVHHPSAFVQVVRTARISESDRENIFHRNSRRILKVT